MRDGHVEDAARDVAEDVSGAAKNGSDLAQDVAEGVLGAAKNGGMQVFIVKVLYYPSSRQEPSRCAAARQEPSPTSGHLTSR